MLRPVESNENATLLRARYVAPLDKPLIETGAVLISGARIVTVAPAADIPARDARVVDLGDAVLLPGFVNAHTHLELSHLAGRVPVKINKVLGMGRQNAGATGQHRPDVPTLIDWLARLMSARMEIGDVPEVVQNGVRSALTASLAAGVVALGDITRLPQLTRPVLRGGPARVISFGEVAATGTRRQFFAERLQAALDDSHTSSTLTIALSPHAPYSVEPAGMSSCAQTAARLNLPLCVHVAETAEEELFTLQRSGPFEDELRRLGIWDDDIPCGGLRPIPLLDRAGLLGNRTLLAHANYANDDDIALLAARGTHVAYCPRTHATFGHAPHPWRKMLAAGVNVCIGTDSLASNPSLSILDELRFLHERHPEVGAGTLFSMACRGGAAALGLSGILGSITPGLHASLVAIPLSRPWRDPLVDVLESDVTPSRVWMDGKKIL